MATDPGKRTLSANQLDRLREEVWKLLSEAHLQGPLAGEKEPQFTARVIARAVKAMVGRVVIEGLHVAGDGAAPVRTVNFLGSYFRPDLGISLSGQPLLAIEVKFLRGVARQNSLATAIGQGAIYGGSGFPHVLIFAVDFGGRTSRPDYSSVTFANGIGLIVRDLTVTGWLGPNIFSNIQVNSSMATSGKVERRREGA